jgi:hypothetical protein
MIRDDFLLLSYYNLMDIPDHWIGLAIHYFYTTGCGQVSPPIIIRVMFIHLLICIRARLYNIQSI